MCLAHLEEEDAGNSEDPDSEDPSRIEEVTDEFMVYLARAMKDAQAEKKCPEHFIHNCLLVKSSRDKKQLNGMEGVATIKEPQTPLTTTSATKSHQTEAPKA